MSFVDGRVAIKVVKNVGNAAALGPASWLVEVSGLRDHQQPTTAARGVGQLSRGMGIITPHQAPPPFAGFT